MPDDFIKLPLQSSLNRAATARAEEAIQNTGRALPCKVTAVEGSIVTVIFEANIPYQQPDGTIAVYQLPPITLAKAESQWMRSPTQVGDFGLTLPADTFLGGISGIGTGVADTGVDYGNLSGTRLVWVPVAALSFASAPSPNQAWVNGPGGAVISDTPQTATMTASLNNVTHVAGSGASQVKTIYDGVGNAISHVVSTGGLIGVGVLASSSTSAQAAYNHTHITSLVTNEVQSRIQDMSTMAVALKLSGLDASGLVEAYLLGLSAAPSALGLVTGLFPLPTIPSGSSIVRLP